MKSTKRNPGVYSDESTQEYAARIGVACSPPDSRCERTAERRETIEDWLADLEKILERSLEQLQKIESCVGTTPVPCDPQGPPGDKSLLGRLRDASFVACEIGSAIGRIQDTLGIQPE